MGNRNPDNEVTGWVDSHAHLDMPEFDHDRTEVLERAFTAGIQAVMCPMEAADGESIRKILELMRSRPGVIAAAGVHPHNAKHFTADAESEIRRLAAAGSIHALGEIGLDFHYRFSAPEKQIQVFRRQLRTAQELDLPVIIHSRQAQEAVLTSLAEEGYSRGGVVHCFTESRDFADLMVEKGFYISFSGIVTFPKARDIQETARGLPLERLLVETDSPYLVPSPYRGRIKRNEPKYVRETARFLADLKGISQARMAKATSENFSRCFGFEFRGY
jgi:TatD DNase family protein